MAAVENLEALRQLAERHGLKLDNILGPTFLVACQDGTFKKARRVILDKFPPEIRRFLGITLETPRKG